MTLQPCPGRLEGPSGRAHYQEENNGTLNPLQADNMETMVQNVNFPIESLFIPPKGCLRRSLAVPSL